MHRASHAEAIHRIAFHGTGLHTNRQGPSESNREPLFLKQLQTQEKWRSVLEFTLDQALFTESSQSTKKSWGFHKHLTRLPVMKSDGPIRHILGGVWVMRNI